MNKLIIAFFLISFWLTSCINHKQEYKISQIDTLLNEVQLVHNHLSEIKIDSVSIIINEMSLFVDAYKKVDPKVLTSDDFKLFGHSTDVHKTLNRFRGAYSLVQKEITNSEHQLASLKHDVEFDLLTDSIYNKYILTEREIIFRLHNDFDDKLVMYNDKMELFRFIRYDIQEMIKKIEKLPQKEKEDKVK